MIRVLKQNSMSFLSVLFTLHNLKSIFCEYTIQFEFIFHFD